MYIKSLTNLTTSVTVAEIQEHIQKVALRQIAESKFLKQLSDKFAEIERQGFTVSDLVMNNVTYVDFRKLGRDVLEVSSGKKFFDQCLFAKIWGARIWVVSKTKYQLENQEIKFYKKDDETLMEDFPEIAEALKNLSEYECPECHQIGIPSALVPGICTSCANMKRGV
jgi:hypothetical protein